MAKFVSKNEIVEALNNYDFLVNSRAVPDEQVESKRKLCKLYSERIDAIELDKGAKFDLSQLNSAMLGTGGSVESNVYYYFDKCKNMEQLEDQLQKLYATLKRIADCKSQEKAEEIVATISEANLIKFGLFLAVAIALAIGAIVMTVLGFVHIISDEISNGTATVIGLVDLVLGLSFFVYERYTDMRKDSVKKQAKEYPAEFAQHYESVITNSVMIGNVIGNNNRVGGLFVSMKNSVTLNMRTKLKNSAGAMKQIKVFAVNDDGEEEEN